MKTRSQHKSAESLLENYRTRSEAERLTLQLLSLMYVPCYSDTLLVCLQGLRVRGAGGGAPSSKDVSALLAGLAKQGLVVRDYGEVLASPLVIEAVARICVAEGNIEAVTRVIRKCLSERKSWFYSEQTRFNEAVAEFRLAFYGGEYENARQQLDRIHRELRGDYPISSVLVNMLNNPFDEAQFAAIPRAFQVRLLEEVLEASEIRQVPTQAMLAYLDRLLPELDSGERETLLAQSAESFVLRGDVAEAKRRIESLSSPKALRVRAWIDLLQGRIGEAVEGYGAAMAAERKNAPRKRRFVWHDFSGLHYPLALLRSGRPEHMSLAEDLLAYGMKDEKHPHSRQVMEAFREVQTSLAEDRRWTDSIRDVAESADNWMGAYILFVHLSSYWIDSAKATGSVPNLERLFEQSEQCGQLWVAAEAAELICRLDPAEAHAFAGKAQSIRQSMGVQTIVDIVHSLEPWERALAAISSLAPQAKAESQPTNINAVRLVWHISHYEMHNTCHVSPVEQKLDARGKWSKGRSVALSRLCRRAGKQFDYLTPQDLEICMCIRPHQRSYRYGGTAYELDHEKAIPLLVGHPLLFLADSPDVRVDLTRGEPVLAISQEEGQLRLSLKPELPTTDFESKIVVVRDAPARLRVIEVTSELRRLSGILKDGLQVPAKAKDRVMETIANVTHLAAVHSDVGGLSPELDIEAVPSDPRPHIHLLPEGVGLKIEMLVQPFTGGETYCHPGKGGESLIAEVDGKRMRTERNLHDERERAKKAIDACPSLQERSDGDYSWALGDPEECLELLLDLMELGEDVPVEWPQGGRMSIQRSIGLPDLRMKIHWENNWFNTTGEVKVDESLTLGMRELVELAEKSTGRFLPLGEGRFLALTREFRRRLDEVRAYGELHGDGLRFHPLAAMALEETTDAAASFVGDTRWKDLLKRAREAMVRCADVPSTLQTELRDYQVEGFRWLDRLAHWGVGACLADDMGLGKTIQALALLLTRAAAGPALVVAPTSVSMNWVSEANRFAPTLNMIQFGPEDRARVLAELKPYDVVVTTYTLLQQEHKLMTGVEWETIVLDEAQAIKNMATRRSQAAMGLKGKFRLITTGTPIENHLGEIWNLFRFINPGLLGSIERFNNRFAIAIEKNQDKETRTRLRKLIQPFILRRTKAQVLQELPSRTEILRLVKLTPEETALYEAVRRRALENLEGSKDKADQAGQARIRVLAEIMKLRRTCCNAQLVAPDANLPSSRLAEFWELVAELLEGNHKALVFSQFVDHLTIIRKFIEEKGISYQYLDGSTPLRERKQRVDAFQRGEGDLFLISLKAGGLGLNLTAADYVIHMDPWWNPAVEDQASDRAHRIGQLRPVTIYRLVAENTIEQRIVQLHEHKRDLADNLLEGTDMSGRMSTEDLMGLLRGVL